MKLKKFDIQGPVLVTGGTGFLGKSIVNLLIQENIKVIVLLRKSSIVPSHWGNDVELSYGDIFNRSDVNKAVKSANTVIHLAAITRDWDFEINFKQTMQDGTENIMSEAAKFGIKVVLASSCVVYGDRLRNKVCDEACEFGKPLGLYSKYKQIQEQIAKKYVEKENLKLIIIRPSNIYGPGSGPWVNTLLKELRRKTPVLIDSGNRNAGLAYVDNVAEFFLLAASNLKSVGNVYNVSDNLNVTWCQYATDLSKMVNTASPKSMPYSVAICAAYILEAIHRVLRLRFRPIVTKEALNIVSSDFNYPIDKAINELGYHPSVSYEEAMQKIKFSLEKN